MGINNKQQDNRCERRWWQRSINVGTGVAIEQYHDNRGGRTRCWGDLWDESPEELNETVGATMSPKLRKECQYTQEVASSMGAHRYSFSCQSSGGALYSPLHRT